MAAMDIKRLEQRLRVKERELQEEIQRLEDEARQPGEADVGDFADAAIVSQGASDALDEETLLSQTLAEVQAALRRIQDGTYGKCVACGRPIEEARLEAVPWAAYCKEDQEKYDRAAHVQQGGATL